MDHKPTKFAFIASIFFQEEKSIVALTTLQDEVSGETRMSG